MLIENLLFINITYFCENGKHKIIAPYITGNSLSPIVSDGLSVYSKRDGGDMPLCFQAVLLYEIINESVIYFLTTCRIQAPVSPAPSLSL